MNKVPIVLLTDENYVVPTGVAIWSIIKNNPPKSKLEIYVIAANLSRESIALFLKMNSNLVKINIIEADNSFTKKFDKDDKYVTGTALMKFEISKLLPQYDKVLYIDGDILVRKDITPLLEIDIGSAYAAVVSDMAATEVLNLNQNLGLKSYFNSGVMLLNTKRLRDEGLREKLYQQNDEHPEYILSDQDVFNVIFNDDVMYLPLKNNVMMFNFLLHKFSIKDISRHHKCNYTSFQAIEKDSIIIHLTNAKKPWWYHDTYMADEWYQCFLESPFGKKELKFRDAPISRNLFALNTPETVVKSSGPFKKVWTEALTVISFMGVQFARKEKAPNFRQIRLFGLNLVKRKCDNFTYTTYLLGIPLWRKNNYPYWEQRAEEYTARLSNAISGIALNNVKRAGLTPECSSLKMPGAEKEIFDDISNRLDLYHQLVRLEEMKRRG